MHGLQNPKLIKWPFYLGDALLVITAVVILTVKQAALSHSDLLFVVGCIVGAAIFGILPHVLEYRALVQMLQAEGLREVFARMKQIEALAEQISAATGKWMDVRTSADKSVSTAGEITERMTAELKSFTEFMQRADTAEKSNLRLEVDKLRRAEADWVTALVRILDHTFALHQGALRSGLPAVVQQVGHFQHACRDAARRIGLVPYVPEAAEPFDGQRHQLAENGAKPGAGAVVSETLATGYTLQGKVIRPAVVKLRENGEAPSAKDDSSALVKAPEMPPAQG